MLKAFDPVSVLHLLRARAVETPFQRAFSFQSDNLSVQTDVAYSEFLGIVEETARGLPGVVRGDRVVITADPGLDFAAAFYAVLMRGGVAVPCFPTMSNGRGGERLAGVIADCSPKLLLHSERSGRAPPDFGVPLISVAAARAGSSQWVDALPDVDPQDLAILQYTSGSTAKPKGVMLTHANIVANAAVMAFAMDGEAFGAQPAPLRDPERCVDIATWLPPYHDLGLMGGIVMPVYFGRPAALLSYMAFLQRPIRWLQMVGRTGARISAAPNFAYDTCVRRASDSDIANLDLSAWTRAIISAEPIRPGTIEAFAARFAVAGFRRTSFYPCYGLAEATLMVTGPKAETSPVIVPFDAASLEAGIGDSTYEGQPLRTLVGCGPVLPSFKLDIVDAGTGAVQADGIVGEIRISGPSVSSGYWGANSSSPTTLDASTFQTGDLGFLKDGVLFVSGRLKDLLIVRGRNLHPHDLEQSVVAAHDSFSADNVLVFGATGVDGEEIHVVIGVMGEPDRLLIEAAAAARSALYRQHQVAIQAVYLVRPAAIPRTPSGKLQRNEARRRVGTRELDVLALWRAGGRQSAAASKVLRLASPTSDADLEVWVRVFLATALDLEEDSIGVDDPLSDFGLDSLLAVELSAQLEAVLGRPFSAVLLFEAPTVRALATLLSGEMDASRTPARLADGARQRAQMLTHARRKKVGAET